MGKILPPLYKASKVEKCMHKVKGQHHLIISKQIASVLKCILSAICLIVLELCTQFSLIEDAIKLELARRH